MSDPMQPSLFDEELAAEERSLFGDQLRPMRMDFAKEGDFIHGHIVGVDRAVDLKTGFAPVDVWTVEALSGIHKAGTERLVKGRRYAIAVLHATMKNRIDELDPEPAEGERVAVRRDRDFVSRVEGPSYGKTLVAYQVVMPDRAALGDEPEPTKQTGRSRKT